MITSKANMKNLILLLSTIAILSSCGGDELKSNGSSSFEINGDVFTVEDTGDYVDPQFSNGEIVRYDIAFLGSYDDGQFIFLHVLVNPEFTEIESISIQSDIADDCNTGYNTVVDFEVINLEGDNRNTSGEINLDLTCVIQNFDKVATFKWDLDVN